MNFNVHITRNVEKDIKMLGSINNEKTAINEMKKLKKQPEKGKVLKGKLRGYYSLSFSFPGSQARAIYTILEEEKIILIIAVGYRENIYEQAVRRVK